MVRHLRGRITRIAGMALILTCLSPARVCALDPTKAVTQYVLDVWQRENGLPQNAVYAITQTRDGYLWLGTPAGLARFDGVGFTVFSRANTPGLLHNDVRALLEDSSGDLWIGTYGGGVSRLHKGTFSPVASAAIIGHDLVRAFYEDKDGRVWIGTQGGGVAVWQNGKFTRYTTRDGLAHDLVKTIQGDRAGNIWIGTFGGGLSRFTDGKFSTISKKQGLAGDIVFGIAEDIDGSIWVATYDGGLSHLQDGKIRNYRIADGLADNRLNAVQVDRDGSLWIGTYGGGLQRLRAGKFSTLSMADGLGDNLVFVLYEDRLGQIWAGTLSGGVSRLRDGAVTSYTAKEGFAGDLTFSVYGDGKGTLWAAAEGGGLNYFRDGKWSSTTTRDGLSSNNVVAVLGDRKGRIWAGTFGAGLNVLEHGRIRTLHTKDGLAHEIIYSLFEDRAGDLWIGTGGGGLNVHRNGKFITYTTRDGLLDAGIRAITQSADGSIWVGSSGGLNRIRNGKFTGYTKKDGLPGNTVFSLLADPDGTIWIGTRGDGLARLREGKFTSYRATDGLIDETIFSIIDDGRGNLWFNSSKGLFVVARTDLDQFAEGKRTRISGMLFDRSDGMKTSNGSGGAQPSSWYDQNNGHLWFPTARGVARIGTWDHGSDVAHAQVRIERLLVNDRTITAGEAGRLPPHSRNLEFHYTALQTASPEKIAFRYRIDGLDEDWIEAGTRRVAYYSSIPPGSHTFRVMAADRKGNWPSQATVLQFGIRPAFYETKWFVGLLALAAILVGAGGQRMRVRQLKARERELAAIVELRTSELAEANKSLERLSFQDGLTGIANRRELDRVLTAEWQRGRRSLKPLSVILVDVDHFKLYNDNYGHAGGDECLRRIAGGLASAVRRPTDLVARYGGEEFAMVLAETDAEGAMRVAGKARECIAQMALEHGYSPIGVHITLSVGVATAVPDSGAEAVLLADADAALYEAKKSGRDRIVQAATRAGAVAGVN